MLFCFRELVEGLVCAAVRMSGQGGHRREGGQRYMRRQVGSPTVTLLGGFGEGLNDCCLIVLFLLDVEGQPLPQVVAS